MWLLPALLHRGLHYHFPLVHQRGHCTHTSLAAAAAPRSPWWITQGSSAQDTHASSASPPRALGHGDSPGRDRSECLPCRDGADEGHLPPSPPTPSHPSLGQAASARSLLSQESCPQAQGRPPATPSAGGPQGEHPTSPQPQQQWDGAPCWPRKQLGRMGLGRPLWLPLALEVRNLGTALSCRLQGCSWGSG